MDRRLAPIGMTAPAAMAAPAIAAVGVHDLLRVNAQALIGRIGPAPAWVSAALTRAPWVVVRRETARAGLLAVGVRGSVRGERFATWIAPADVIERIAPERLVSRRHWVDRPRLGQIPALQALKRIAERLADGDTLWGPVGSVGFELASGVATTSATSDLDLLVRAPRPLARSTLRVWDAAVSTSIIRVDVQIETPLGAVALAELAAGAVYFALRTANGPVRVSDPWADRAGSEVRR